MKIACLLLLAVLAPDPAGAPPVVRGLLRLNVTLPPGQSVPRDLEVRVRPSRVLRGQEAHPWEVSLSSPLHDGQSLCEVPAGRVDLRFQGTALMPAYQWNVPVKEGETKDLTVKLERGAAISGWVRTVDEAIPTHSVLVSLAPEVVGSLGLPAKPLRMVSLEYTTRPWGFFRFAGVKPGRYVIRASEPGLPTAHSGPIVIEGDRSVEMPEPLWVTPPVGLDVTVHPFTAPNERPWSFILQPDRRMDEGETWQPLTGTGSRLGRWQAQGLPPGDYWLGIGLAEDNVWQKQKVTLLRGSRALNALVQLIPVHGRLTWREGPLAAALDFNNARGSASFRSDSQGRFEGFLPDEGPWEIRVSGSQALRFDLNLQGPVRVPKGAPFAALEIRIPDTALPLEVVDERGRSLPRSTVNVLGRIRNQAVTDDFGKLTFIGLNPGPQCLLAARGDPYRLSERSPVALHEGDGTPPVRLVVPDRLDISGRILPHLGFASGAQVLAWPAGSGTGVPVEISGSDEDGGFGLALPPGTRKVSLVVLPPGSALRILDAEVARARLLEIHVDAPGGTLVLDLPGQDLAEEKGRPKDGRDEDPCAPAARGRKALTMPRLLRRWADLQGTPQTPGRLVVPNVEPGPYTLCATDGAPVLRHGAPPEGDPRCIGGVLEAAGELALKLPQNSSPVAGR
ncbi:MAG: carboxypeptidase-like regulatory domain-containing protein [Thermoanaerobaculia bacterium]